MKRYGILWLILWGCTETLPERSFSFCTTVTETGCVPPRLSRRVLLTVTPPKARATMADFYHQVYFAGDTLAFEYFPAKDNKTLSPDELKQLQVFYRVDGGERYPMERIDYRRQGITGFSLVGSILEKKYAGEKNEPFRLPPPLQVEYEIELAQKILHKARTELTLRLQP